jgi:hypothetical protein
MKWIATILSVAGTCAGVLAAFLAWLAWTQSRLPFNSEGRYFDGLVVHLEQTALGYAVATMSFGALALTCVWTARRLYRRAQRVTKGREN